MTEPAEEQDRGEAGQLDCGCAHPLKEDRHHQLLNFNTGIGGKRTTKWWTARGGCSGGRGGRIMGSGRMSREVPPEANTWSSGRNFNHKEGQGEHGLRENNQRGQENPSVEGGAMVWASVGYHDTWLERCVTREPAAKRLTGSKSSGHKLGCLSTTTVSQERVGGMPARLTSRFGLSRKSQK